ncbi:hypothetical protein QTP70_025855 [Hemibagrus guttatus]|uniref:Immunoglobulin V-set domain-containing protein n=1 Tax=Hemibagrus guttatus TaxID=175788 RepID=A0AAE0UX23_9TELE|nr:hypothetical protein QTP70_025855 [Hemibagrus guttatus]
MTLILIFLLFVFQGVEGGADENDEIVLNENESKTIYCTGEHSGSVFWLRMKGNGFEYIGTYSKSKKTGTAADKNKFTVKEKSLELKHFQQETDSGYYSCVSINNNALDFSSTFKLRGEKVVSVQPTSKPKITTVQPVTSRTTAAVTCPQNAKGGKKPEKIDVLLGCELHIFIPLVAGCGFLLLLLIITIVYCNRIRTRRCPHHYKRH